MNVSNFWMLMNVAQTWHKRCTNSINVQRFVQRLSNGLQAIFETSHKRIRCATVCATFDQRFASHFRISRISTTTTATTTTATTTTTTIYLCFIGQFQKPPTFGKPLRLVLYRDFCLTYTRGWEGHYGPPPPDPYGRSPPAASSSLGSTPVYLPFYSSRVDPGRSKSLQT